MKTLGNIIWVLFGGLAMAVEYIMSGVMLCLTIIGIPFGLQVIKLGLLAVWPFGSHVVNKPQSSGCISVLMNILWFLLGGIIIVLSHVFFGIVFYITIIGIPFGNMHFRLARLALTPFGKEVV